MNFGNSIEKNKPQVELFINVLPMLIGRMVRPLKMAVLLLSLHPLPDQCLLHRHSTQKTDLPTYLPQAPAGDCSYQRGSEGHASQLVSLVTNEPT